MEERLDDAIWVLKSHAENPSMRGMPPLGYPAAAYPQGMTEALQVLAYLLPLTPRFMPGIGVTNVGC